MIASFKKLTKYITDKCITNLAKNRRHRTWFGRMIDKNDQSYALSSVIIVVIMILSTMLLSVCIFAIGIEAWYTHTVSSDINGWSLFIGSVTALISTACGLKWGINYTDRKFPDQRPQQQDYDGIGDA